MAFNDDQKEFPLPGGENGKRRSAQHLPRYFRTQVNNKFLSSTFDQFIQPGQVEKISGFFGQRQAKAKQAGDNYVLDVSKERQDYQLEPAAVIRDDLGNLEFYKDYNDYINQIRNLRGTVSDHSILNRQEYYAWNPHIDWDKFSNFRDYFWLPNGPDPVPVAGKSINVESTYTVTSVDEQTNRAFVFSPDGLTSNPNLTLYRGITYRFEIDSPGTPISIRRSRIIARPWQPQNPYRQAETVLFEGEIYIAAEDHRSAFSFEQDRARWNKSTDINLAGEASAQSVEQGLIEFTPTFDTPDVLYYVADNDINASGEIRIFDIEEAAFIDVEKEILGKRTYRTGKGFDLSNGMKIFFQGTTSPKKYETGNWYVEGVGDAIKLVSESDLTVSSAFVEDEFVEFDSEGFDRNPYSFAIGFPRNKDYITINRSARDGNLWSKYNRWFHKDVVENAAAINKTGLFLDQNARATRPIIEFEAGLKLFDFGTQLKQTVDLVDNFTVDVFSIIEGSEGYNIDGVDVADGMRILFTADTDILVKNKIYRVQFINFQGRRQISLVEADDAEPLDNETVLCIGGTDFGGRVLYFTGETWKLAQDKIAVNQPPLFDVFDCDGFSLSDPEIYTSTNFTGTRIFSYKVGNSPVDPELGFALSYQNVQNVGDIVFDFNLSRDAAVFCPEGELPRSVQLGTGFLRNYDSRENFVPENGWVKGFELSSQTVISEIIAGEDFVLAEIDVYDNSAQLDDLETAVFVDNALIFESVDYVVLTEGRETAAIAFTPGLIRAGSVIRIKTKSSALKNDRGFYEIPHNLERNPNNNDLEQITLGEINDHVNSIIENATLDRQTFSISLRDAGDLSPFGKRVVQHSAPLSIALYHLTDEDANLAQALRYAKSEYSKFKRSFLQAAFDSTFDGPVDEHFEVILARVLANRKDTDPFYFSDMVPAGGSKTSRITVRSQGESFFSLSEQFSLGTLSNNAVLVYLNGVQLIAGHDYEFTEEGFVRLKFETQIGAEIVIREFETTDGNFVPATPTKLGIYPKYRPQMYIDDTYQESKTVIQGHDGSIILAFGDFRDDLLLELEKRIYNNIKIAYDPSVFNIFDYVPGDNRNTGLTVSQINNVLSRDFTQWLSFIEFDFTENNFDVENEFTYNHKGLRSRYGKEINGFWRSVYKQIFDTDRPHSHPWEMLGFSEKPFWWDEEYGSAPYTSNNLLMWEDIEQGIIREPGKSPVIKEKFTRENLTTYLPVDQNGNLLPPAETNLIKNFVSTRFRDRWEFGDHGPVETAWRRSSEYPFALITALFLNQPNRVISGAFDRSRQFRNSADQLIYNAPNNRLKLKDIAFPNIIDDADRRFTSGLVNYVRDWFVSANNRVFETYKERLQALDVSIGGKLAGYASKDKLKFILDSRSPLSEGNVFVPDENYQIAFNKSTPTRLLYYSGVIIEKRTNGFAIRGYNEEDPIFKWNKPLSTDSDSVIRVGGISEPIIQWTPRRTLTKGVVVENQNRFFRVTEQHTTTAVFESDKFAPVAGPAVRGGREAELKTRFSSVVENLNYNTVLPGIQDVVDFILGYSYYLETQGFVFDYFDSDSREVANWITSVKEYLFWSTQNWAEGAVIALSPGAFSVTLETQFETVDSVFDSLYGYGIIKVDGERLEPQFISISREDTGKFLIRPKITSDGIYGLRIPLVQKEHVVLFDDRTSFGDIIYDKAAGYRQERIKVLGYRTTDWDGSINIPGFIWNQVTIKDWESWRDYDLGDVVRHKEFFYTADTKVIGTAEFQNEDWVLLPKRPESELLPNFDYRSAQFADFYDLDSDNFDSEQQRFAQHLVGYQNRQYLANIINDDVSQYKFYQGFIREKGTQNAFRKLFDALGAENKESVEFYEEWAIKSAQYGASEGFEEIEYPLDESRFRLSPQPIRLVDRKDPEATNLIYEITPSEVGIQPRNYNHAPFPEKIIKQTFVKDSGYVNPDDVEFIVDEYSSIVNINFNSLSVGNRIWVGNDGETWQVYAAVRVSTKITTAETTDDGISIELADSRTEFSNGEIIAVYNIGPASGIYEIASVQNNKITLLSQDADDPEIGTVRGTIVRFIKTRFDSINQTQRIVTDIDNGISRLWLDESSNGLPIVAERIDQFDIAGQVENLGFDENENYGTAIATNSRNTVLAVGAPDDESGKVYVYTRPTESSEFTLSQIIEPVNNLTSNLPRFGASVAVSPDGRFIAIGAPAASNVKSQFKNEFDSAVFYNQRDIVQFSDSLWQAIVNILPETASVEFESFESVAQVLDNLVLDFEGAPEFNTIITGKFPFTNIETDHILIKAPKKQYDGSDVGFDIKVKWNTISYAYQNQTNLNPVEPFDGDIPGLDADFLTNNLHTIAEKIDSVLFIPAATTVPQVGQIVESNTAIGEVAFVHNDLAVATIYIKNRNGDFTASGSLTTDIGEFVGEYETVAGRETIAGADEVWEGLWKIDLGFNINVDQINSDSGRGLVYVDVIPSGEPDPEKAYFNILDFSSNAFSSFDTRSSEIVTLSYFGNPGPTGVVGEFLSDLYAVRAPLPLTNDIAVGDEIEFFYNPLRDFETDSFIDPALIGLSINELNQTQTVVDIWDGYIDFNITRNLAGVPIEPKVGITVQDVTNLGTAEIVFYQRFTTESGRIYVKNVQGTWAAGAEFGENREIQFLADGSGDSLYDPAAGFRVFGQTQSRSLGFAAAGIGQMLVFQRAAGVTNPVQLADKVQDRILNGEYWFYETGIVQGRSRAANIPSQENADWQEVFNVPAGVAGDPSGLTNEGYYSIFQKSGSDRWSRINNFVVPQRTDNQFLGTDVKFSSFSDLTRLHVLGKGNQEQSNFGKIYIVKNGIENNQQFNWDLGKNKQYRGEFSETRNYAEGDVVFRINGLLEAQTNIVAGLFEPEEWQTLTVPIDYVGFIPNTTGLTLDDINVIDTAGLTEFAKDFDVDNRGEVVVTSAQFDNGAVKIFVYRNLNGLYVKTQTIQELDQNETYGVSIAISGDGRFIAVGSPEFDGEKVNQGKVFIYKQIDGEFTRYQTLFGPDRKQNEQFGIRVSFSDDFLAVTSRNAGSRIETGFDSNQTTFDNSRTKFSSTTANTGVIRIFELVDGSLLFGQTIDLDEEGVRFFGKNLYANQNHIYVGLPGLSGLDGQAGRLVNYSKETSSKIWTTLRTVKPTVDISKIKQAIIYDRATKQLIDNLDYIDPLQGKIAGIAEQEISYKTPHDPAVYTIGIGVEINPTRSWSKTQVGEIWWDLSTAKFRNPFVGGTLFSANNWNTLFSDFNSIDVYEWVETDLTPNQWDAISETAEGFSRGITGRSRSGNQAYVEKRTFNRVTKSFEIRRYFWVRNKQTVPNISDRNISARAIADLIRDPAAAGYRFVAFISPTELAIFNVNSLIRNQDVAVKFQYWIIDDQSINIHNEYQIITDGLDSSRPKIDVERKWFDSLVGFDEQRRAVPARNLAEQEKYGILNTPRQSWFINKIEALKQAVERINRVFIKSPIADERNISRLREEEQPPRFALGLYDRTVESRLDLDFVGVARARTAILDPVIENGRLVRVDIVDRGRGYLTAPSAAIVGTGTGAQIALTINNRGEVVDVEVEKSGELYTQATLIVVRPFTILVESDETISGRWALFERSVESREWIRTASQGFNVNLYWEFVNWYAEGYSEFTNINIVVNFSFQLQQLDDSIGDIIKIENISEGGWSLLEKIDDQVTDNFTVNYRTVGRQDGTIQLRSSLYDAEENLAGYDVTNFDLTKYDGLPSRETRIILEALRDNIFTSDLAIEYNQLFFASLRYVFSEQGFVDWAFKTSFIKAQHNVGELEQRITFQNDNLPNFEDYAKEVKPYSTNIREYLSNYNRTEPTNTLLTDFDLPAKFDPATNRIEPFRTQVVNNEISVLNDVITDSPEIDWQNAVGFEVTEIVIADAGSGYTSAPVISIRGGGGEGATAVASVGVGGRITSIRVTDPGSGYLSQPTVEINGSIREGGTPARAAARIGNSPVRSIYTAVKFDRISGQFEFATVNTAETFTGSGSRLAYSLEWPVDLRTTRFSVRVNGVEALTGTYKITNTTDISKGYTRTQGLLEFRDPPADAAEITVEYVKDIGLLNAQDRIRFSQGVETTSQLATLMDGVDYGGVEVTSFGFEGTSGWDAEGWIDQPYDNFDQNFEDEIAQLDGSTIEIQLSKPLEADVTYNIYRVARDTAGNIVSNTRMDDPNFGTPDQTNPDATTASIIGDGAVTVIFLDELNIPSVPVTAQEDTITIIIRKITSDGSFIPDPTAFDMSLRGGSFDKLTATGLNAADITVDGDGFVTPTTSKGPEEVVPGQVLDTLDLKVFERPDSGSSQITSLNYRGDGVRTVFEVGSTLVNLNGLFVKINNDIISDNDYFVNVSAKTIILNTPLAQDSVLNIVNLGFSGTNIFDIDIFTADGETTQFLTRAGWQENLQAVITVNGVVQQATLEESDSGFEVQGNAVVTLPVAPAVGAQIAIMILEQGLLFDSFSLANINKFTGDGSTNQFTLDNNIFAQQPALVHTIVQVGDKILSAGFNQVFAVDARREYQLDLTQVPEGSVSADQIEVYLNGNKLLFLQQWNFIGSSGLNDNINVNIIVLESGVGLVGDELKVYILSDAEYRFGEFDTDGTFISARGEDSSLPILNLDQVPAAGEEITVYTFSNHDSQGIERQNFDAIERTVLTPETAAYFDFRQLQNGLIKLRKQAAGTPWVWAIVNGKLQIPNVDYTLVGNRNFVKFNTTFTEQDTVEILHFASTPVQNTFGWRQFKDIFNRTHYKRLRDTQSLAEDLHFSDRQIVLNDASTLPDPVPQSNIPGVLFINGERVEYFRKEVNVLKQLRRGTLGTGIKNVYEAGTAVMEQGPQNNIPYMDETEIQEFTSDGTTVVAELGFTLNADVAEQDQIEVFGAGQRLKKNAISVFDRELAQDSPEGDKTQDPEFSIQAGNLFVDEPLPENAKITVVRKLGTRWEEQGKSLRDSKTKISEFLRSATTDLPR